MKINFCSCTATVLLFGLTAVSTPNPVLANEEESCGKNKAAECETAEASGKPMKLAGPEQVENRLHIDSNQVTPMFPSSFARGYFDWKDRIKENNGVGFGGDYSFAYLSASDSPGADDAFGGMYRLFGTWEATSDGKGNSGALILSLIHISEPTRPTATSRMPSSA